MIGTACGVGIHNWQGVYILHLIGALLVDFCLGGAARMQIEVDSLGTVYSCHLSSSTFSHLTNVPFISQPIEYILSTKSKVTGSIQVKKQIRQAFYLYYQALTASQRE